MLTDFQKGILKSDIESNFAANWAAGEVGIIAAAYNTLASPDFYVWKTSVSNSEMHEAYVWTELDSITQLAKWEQFKLMISQGNLNPSLPNVRQGLNDIFTGPNLANTRANLISICKRKATRVEELFSLGLGAGSDADPDTLDFQGVLYPQDIYEAMSNG